MRLIKRDPGLAYIDSNLWLPKKSVNVNGVKKALTYELEGRTSTEILQLWEEAEHHLIVPRAFTDPTKLGLTCIDARPRTFMRTGVKCSAVLDHRFQDGVLRPTGATTQRDAVAALLRNQGGTLQLACGEGKTVCAMYLTAQLQVPALYVVDNTHLMVQWQQEIEQFLTVPGGVGLIQGDTKNWKHGVVMATYQTLANWAPTMPEEVKRWFGLVIWDEGHHVSAPKFSRSAPLFYGFRFALTATPNRPDGQHVICEHHVGGVIFKKIAQKNPPKVIFRWTGLELDTTDQEVVADITAKNGEIHYGKLAGHFGRWKKRLLEHVLPEVTHWVDQGHKVLLLSYSVDEVINLMALWTTGDPNCELWSDIPYPSPEDVDEEIAPQELAKASIKKARHTIGLIYKNLRDNPNLNPEKRRAYEERIDAYKHALKAHEVWKKTEKEYRRRQRTYLRNLLAMPSTAGLFTYDVKPEERLEMLRTRQVIFAITKYGREGLDDSKLSAIVVSEPMSDRNTLQQVMGRTRYGGVLVFLEDSVGPLIGQCKKLRKHLREWPRDEGGPFKYDLIGHPSIKRREAWNRTSIRTPGS